MSLSKFWQIVVRFHTADRTVGLFTRANALGQNGLILFSVGFASREYKIDVWMTTWYLFAYWMDRRCSAIDKTLRTNVVLGQTHQVIASDSHVHVKGTLAVKWRLRKMGIDRSARMHALLAPRRCHCLSFFIGVFLGPLVPSRAIF